MQTMRIGQTLRDGLAAVQARQFDRARALLERCAGESPDDVRVWFWLAVASQSGAAAIPCLRRVLLLEPSHAQARTALAKLLVVQAVALMEHDRAQARTLLSEAAAIAPDQDAIWIALASASDEPADRVSALRRAFALNADRPGLRARFHDSLVHHAVMLAKTSHTADARNLFREASELDPADARVWQALALLAETPAESVHALRNLVRVAPDHANHRGALKKALAADARALATAGNKSGSEARWREALAIDDRDPLLWLGLASVLTGERAIREAVDTAHRLDPANEHATAWLARLDGRDRAAAAKRREPPAAHAAAAAAPAPAAGTITIMVVDDSPTIRKILGLTLERAGYAVVAEPDGERAVARLAEVVPDLILLDISMPKLDGYEVCKRIRKDPRTAQVPVVMLSGKDGFFDKVKGRMVGASEYLTKPFEAPAVLAVIRKHCKRRAEAVRG